MGSEETTTITPPNRLSFSHNGVYDFDSFLSLFDWTLRDHPVQIDFRECRSANYQALSLFREAAAAEVARSNANDQKQSFYFNMRNYFGPYAEDKQLAIKLRDEKLLSAIEEGLSITIDFDEVISAPHSLLSALLATPVQMLGLAAYKRIKVINACTEMRETVDFIMDENTSIA